MAMDESRDEELVYQSLDDADEGAFEILYHRYEMSLLNFFYRRVGSWETAQDSDARDVYQRCIHISERFGIAKKFSSWMFSIARQLIAAHIRESQRTVLKRILLTQFLRRITIEPEHRSPVESIIAEEQMAIVRALWRERLPASERRAFELRLREHDARRNCGNFRY